MISATFKFNIWISCKITKQKQPKISEVLQAQSISLSPISFLKLLDQNIQIRTKSILQSHKIVDCFLSLCNGALNSNSNFTHLRWHVHS
jgi:hypothetical protein